MEPVSTPGAERSSNLVRAAASRPPLRRASAPQAQLNVGRGERAASALMGSALLVGAVAKASPARVAFVIGGSALLHRAVTGHCYLYQALGHSTASEADRRAASARSRSERSITVERPLEELYRAWHDPQHLAASMGEFAEVQALPGERLQFRVKVAGRPALEWTMQTVEDRPNELIVWKTEPGSKVVLESSVRFRPAPRDWGTVVTLSLGFESAGGVLAGLSAKLFPGVSQSLEERVLRRSKNLCVAGELPSLKHNPAARGA